MPIEDDLVVEAAKQGVIAKIYDDVFHPTAIIVGDRLQGATKIALSPLSAMIWGYDQISQYIEEKVSEYFKKKNIKEEEISTPDPSIAVPIIETMRYSCHKPELQEMFINLLGASMNSNSIDEHPSFVEIIKQLSSDECKMIKYLKNNFMLPMLKLKFQVNDGGGGEIDATPYFSDLCYKVNCCYPNKFPEYLDNLCRLGLVETLYNEYLAIDELYIELRSNSNFPVPNKNHNEYKIVDKKSVFLLTEFGKKFCEVCV